MGLSKLKAICDILREELQKGIFTIGSRFPSEYELAERFSVNKTTANKAVGLLVNEGYLERGISGAGTRVKTHLIFPKGELLYLTLIGEPFYTSLLHGAQHAAYLRGYLMNYLMVPPSGLEHCFELLSHSKIAGMLTSCYGCIQASLPFPVIHVDQLYQNNEVRTVNCDYYGGGKMIGEEIIRKGHREVVYLSEDPLPLHMSERRRGVFDVLTAAGIHNLEERLFVLDTAPSSFSRGETLKEILKRFPSLSIFICDTDHIALTVWHHLQEFGLAPQHFSFTGYGNVQPIQLSVPITTIDQHPVAMGKCASEYLINLIEGKKCPKNSFTINVEFIDNGSVHSVSS
mgnify:CR=1 FL=1